MILEPVTQRCWIGGQEYAIHDSDIVESLDDISQMQFVIDIDANSGLSVPDEGDEVLITQEADSTLEFHGRVHEMSIDRGIEYTRIRVRARGLGDEAAHIRLLDSFGPASASSIMQSAWQQYGPSGVDLTGIESGAPAVDEYTSTFDSLADLSNYVSKTVGWTWRFDQDGVSFFNPANNPAPDLAQGDFNRGTLSVNRSLNNVYNVARQQAYRYVTTSAQRGLGDVCAVRVGFSGTSRRPPDGLSWAGWEFVEARVVNGVFASDKSRFGVDAISLDDIEVSFDPDDEVFLLSHQMNKSPLRVQGVFRRLVWVRAENPTSIALYGRREAPTLSNNGGMSVNEGLRRLESYLEQHAHPTVRVTGDVVISGIRPGEYRRISLTDPAIDRMFVVDRVRRSIVNNELQVHIEASTPLDQSAEGARVAPGSPEPLPEVIRRLEKLEEAPLNLAGAPGIVAHETGQLEASPVVEASWDWLGQVEIDGVPEVVMEGDWEWDGQFILAPPDAFLTDTHILTLDP